MPRRDPIKLVSRLPEDVRKELTQFLKLSENAAVASFVNTRGLEAALGVQKPQNKGRPN